MSEVEALKTIIKGLRDQRHRAGRDREGWTAWSILNCKIADLELALLLREPKTEGEVE